MRSLELCTTLDEEERHRLSYAGSWHMRMDDRPNQAERTEDNGSEVALLRQRVAELEARLAASATNDRVLRTLFDTLPDNLYVKDRQLRKVLSNRTDWRYMGVASESEALGKTDLEVYSGEEAAHFEQQDLLVLNGASLINHEERITIRGEAHWLLTTKVPLLDETSAVIGLVGLGRNITDLKQAQESRDQLRAANQALEEASRLKDEFLANMSHELSLSMIADPRRLRQILTNLLDNAVKLTPEGGALGLHVTAHAATRTIRFCVWDTGNGIQPDDQGRLFQPFTQLDASLTRRHSGTGLGLVLAKRLAELHGGQASVESTPGEGSRFVITLPWRQASATKSDEGE